VNANSGFSLKVVRTADEYRKIVLSLLPSFRCVDDWCDLFDPVSLTFDENSGELGEWKNGDEIIPDAGAYSGAYHNEPDEYPAVVVSWMANRNGRSGPERVELFHFESLNKLLNDFDGGVPEPTFAEISGLLQDMEDRLIGIEEMAQRVKSLEQRVKYLEARAGGRRYR
jgi:hypothetical protein